MTSHTRIALFALTLSAFSAGCSKEETKTEAPKPEGVAPGVQAAPGAPGVQVKAGGSEVKVGQGGVVVQTPGQTVQVQAPVGAQPGKTVVMQNGQNQVKVEGNTVEAKTGDGRSAVVQGDTVKLKGADGKTVEVKGNTVNAGGVKIEGNNVVVPGVGTVKAQ